MRGRRYSDKKPSFIGIVTIVTIVAIFGGFGWTVGKALAITAFNLPVG